MDDGIPLAIVSFQLVEVQLVTYHLTPEEKKDIWRGHDQKLGPLEPQAMAPVTKLWLLNHFC